MRRFLLIITVVLALAVGTITSRSPGYVLIAYEDMMLQTSLWVAVLGLLVLLLALRWSWVILQAVLGTKNKLAAWSDGRRTAKALDFLGKGVTLRALGELKRGNRYLSQALDLSSTKPVALALLATGDADEAGEAQPSALAALALGSQPQKELAALNRAALALKAGLTDVAAEHIAALPDNPKTLVLASSLARG